MLSKAEISRIESVQKTGLYLVYGPRYKSYTWALQDAKMTSLENQRQKIFEKFTRDCLRSPKFSKWFVKTDSEQAATTRSKKPMFKPVPARTQAYARSPIPQMVALARSGGLPSMKEERGIVGMLGVGDSLP